MCRAFVCCMHRLFIKSDQSDEAFTIVIPASLVAELRAENKHWKTTEGKEWPQPIVLRFSVICVVLKSECLHLNIEIAPKKKKPIACLYSYAHDINKWFIFKILIKKRQFYHKKYHSKTDILKDSDFYRAQQ